VDTGASIFQVITMDKSKEIDENEIVITIYHKYIKPTFIKFFNKTFGFLSKNKR